MALSKHHLTPSSISGALQNSGLSMNPTNAAQSATAGDISSTAPADKSSGKTAVVQYASEQERFRVNNQGFHIPEYLVVKPGQHAAQAAPPPGSTMIGTTAGAGQKFDVGKAPEGRKDTTGKAPVAQGFVGYFRKAMEAVAFCSEYGKKKYDLAYADRNFLKVEDGVAKYSDALQRHWGAHLSGEIIDPESGKPHLDHVGWNAMALLEMRDGMPEQLVDGK
jgi:hypothetical protein